MGLGTLDADMTAARGKRSAGVLVDLVGLAG